MISGVRLKSHKELTKNKDVLVYDKPKYVYIPLIIGNDTSIVIDTKIGDKVLKGDKVAHRTGKFSLPIHSSVSGKVMAFEDKMCYTGNKVKCIKIENDLNETTNNYEVKDIDKYTKKEFIKILEECGIRGLGGADFPTYIKYKTEIPIKNIIINAIECEPYITADYITLKNHYEEIVECIDAIMTINNINNGYIAIKRNNDNIKLLNSIIGTYPKIKIVELPNLYPMGWEKNLVKYILHMDYDRLPIETNTVINNVSTIYSIYNALKNHEELTHHIVTLTGEMLKKPTNVDLKIGTDIKEVLEILGYKKKELFFVAGGPMMGKTIPDDELIVTSNLNCVLLLKNKEYGDVEECMRCGKCVLFCPAKLSPVLIKDSLKDIDELKRLNVDRCVECGLCSYICPAKIMVREYVRRAKKNVRGE